jgi:integrase
MGKLVAVKLGKLTEPGMYGDGGGLYLQVPYAEIGAFMVKLRKQEGVSADALEFAILTAGRTGEVLGASWDEIDLAAKLWTVPAARMLDYRIQQAKALLSQDQLPIAEIAAACGFADQSHLTRVFTNTIGIPPGAWRRENGL